MLLERTPGRVLLGITGPPGAGKSTLAERLVAALAPAAVLVPMDGFHLAEVELERLGLLDRKGAPETFDAAGFVALLERLRAGRDDVVYAPTFRRDLEEPIAGAVPVPRDVRLVVTEGNYLLLARPPWARVRALLDEVWYCAVPDEARLVRLAARHERFGRSSEEAWARTRGSDQRNAELVASTAADADLVVPTG